MAEMKSKNLGDVSGLCATLYSQNQNKSVNPRNLTIQFGSCFQGQINQGHSRQNADTHCSNLLKKNYETQSESQTAELRGGSQNTEASI